MHTDDLIVRLAGESSPVRPLPAPWRRTAAWTIAALAYAGLLILLMPARGDLAVRMTEPRFLLEQLTTLLLGVTAALAAFVSVVPGHRGAVLLLPFGMAAAWVVLVAVGVAQDAARGVPAATAVRPHWACVGAVALGAALPAAIIAAMIRHGAAVRPRVTAALAGLAAAALGNAAACVVHADGSSWLVLLWLGGTMVAATAAAACAGAALLRWPVSGFGVRSI
jgi:hypothetical protein